MLTLALGIHMLKNNTNSIRKAGWSFGPASLDQHLPPLRTPLTQRRSSRTITCRDLLAKFRACRYFESQQGRTLKNIYEENSDQRHVRTSKFFPADLFRVRSWGLVYEGPGGQTSRRSTSAWNSESSFSICESMFLTMSRALYSSSSDLIRDRHISMMYVSIRTQARLIDTHRHTDTQTHARKHAHKQNTCGRWGRAFSILCALLFQLQRATKQLARWFLL